MIGVKRSAHLVFAFPKERQTRMRGLGELLLERGLITQRDCAEARKIQDQVGGRLDAALVRLGALSEDDALGVISEQVALPLLSPQSLPSVEAVRAAMAHFNIAAGWLLDNDAIAWMSGEGEHILNVAGPRLHDPALQEAIEQWRAPETRLFLAPSRVIEPVLISLRVAEFGHGRDAFANSSRLMELAEEAPTVDFVNSVFAEALAARASDVHFEPFERTLVVRLRIDGVLVQRRVAQREIFDAVSSRIKLLSGMDIAERRLPQDGRQSIRVSGRELDVRVSTLPTTWGESLVVRLLGNTRQIPALDELGVTSAQRRVLLEAIRKPNGLVLVTGPTGSGKTTSVYRLLSELNNGVRKIVTIEDPVEFDLPGVLQMTVRADINLDFAAGLRSILRQDPDVIFVGEIRDSQTAKTAVQAALTGHLVISTVHTNSALAALPRLVDLGVEKFLLADVLRAVVGQRLVRRLCPACAVADTSVDPEAYARKVLPTSMLTGAGAWKHGVGCASCAGTGFSGRFGIFEAAAIDHDMQAAIRDGAPESEVARLARAQGFTTLLEHGLAVARAGHTSFLEVLRVVGAAQS